MAWYKDWFRDSNYSTVYEHRDESEAEQMIDLIERTVGHDTSRRVLDLACGSGRHALSFARRGYLDVTGVDLSPTLLAEGAALAAELGYSIRLLERDMRDLPEGPFDLTVNLFTSFGYFDKDEENASVIASVASHLAAGGYLVIDFFNSHWVREHFVAHDERVLSGGRRLEQSRWLQNGRVEKRLLIRDALDATEYIESVRLFELQDFQRMFDACGLRVSHIFGSYIGEAFDARKSSRLIMFAQK